MTLTIKAFENLTVQELHQIYRLRCAVFIVEQACVYQDIDEFDPLARHVLLTEGNELIAYCRILPPETAFEEAAIGRVLAVRRRQGHGSQVVAAAMKDACQSFGTRTIVLEAQVYARTLYEKLGFCQISDEFLEDGIPHIKMKWNAPQL
ncbi:MAG: GNAT family N-acetyltransferase [Oscillospiraceae bacterium]|nr:GNAT family N-acetyltransferase [Oscillospiraceae bacterium]